MMKRKYYLRGLGFGILITTCVFILVEPSELSEEEIIQRAKQLGYVKAEENVKPTINLGELLNKENTQASGTEITIVPNPTETIVIPETITPKITSIPEETLTPTQTLTPTETPKATATLTPTEKPKATATLTPTEKPKATTTPTPIEKPKATTTPTSEETGVVTATIKITFGRSAIMVCKQLEEEGIIESADAMIQYLVDTNQTTYIDVGTYTLSSDMSFEEIANIITLN